MAVVARWKNSELALPLCDPLAMHPVSRPALDAIDPLGCLCVRPQSQKVNYSCFTGQLGPPSPRTVYVELAGITNGTCGACEQYNGFHVLGNCAHVGCFVSRWRKNIGADPCHDGSRTQFVLSASSSALVLQLSGVGPCTGPLVQIAHWIGFKGEANADGSVILSLGGHTAECGNFPSTVLIRPPTFG